MWPKLAVMASGNGSNFEALVKATQNHTLEAEIVCLVCDHADAYVIERAKHLQIPAIILEPRDFKDKNHYERAIVKELEAYDVDVIILAGYMRIVTPYMLDKYPGHILNIHPALLPHFPGRQGIQDAWDAGVSQTGVTVHLIDSGIDSGPILAQQTVDITEDDTLETLEAKIHQVEQRLYAKTIQEFLQAEKEK
ncbi:MAG: phosphoribosylglycinamide formyltransferase [Aerococcus suis]|nr:phosphoribosylglycinamide formyltransferase [Aerococcus suis]